MLSPTFQGGEFFLVDFVIAISIIFFLGECVVEHADPSGGVWVAREKYTIFDLRSAERRNSTALV